MRASSTNKSLTPDRQGASKGRHERWKDSCYSGSINTAGDLVFVGRNDGRFTALDARNGNQRWQFQTDAGVNATATVFQYEGKQISRRVFRRKLVRRHSSGRQRLAILPGWHLRAGAIVTSWRHQARVGQGCNVEAGAKLFSQFCSACHGDTVQGGHGVGPDITKIDSADAVATTVTNGKNKMPPFGSVLTSDQMRDVAVYVAQQLGKK